MRTFHEPGHAYATDINSQAVRQVVQAAGELPGGDAVEVLVVALDPVERRWQRFVAAVVVRHVSLRKPRTAPRVPFHGAAGAGEIAVNVAEGAEVHGLEALTDSILSS